jgi:hypothetical protein
MAAVRLSACNSSAISPPRPFRAISPPASRRSIGSRNRQEPPSRSGRTGRREPTPHRDSLRPRVRSSRPRPRRAARPAIARVARTTPPQGQCSGAADGGAKSGGDHPVLGNQIRPLRCAVSAPDPCLPEIRKRPLNLLHSALTYPCLGHCITRGIGLRRQASILRLSGAALLLGHCPRPRPRHSTAHPPAAPEKRNIEQRNLWVPPPLWPKSSPAPGRRGNTTPIRAAF